MPKDWVQETFRCDCGSPEHMITADIYEWKDYGDVEFFFQVTANQHLFWYQRIIPAIKYMFGYPSLKWHSVDMQVKDVERLENLLKIYREKKKKYERE